MEEGSYNPSPKWSMTETYLYRQRQACIILPSHGLSVSEEIHCLFHQRVEEYQQEIDSGVLRKVSSILAIHNLAHPKNYRILTSSRKCIENSNNLAARCIF